MRIREGRRKVKGDKQGNSAFYKPPGQKETGDERQMTVRETWEEEDAS